MAWRKRGRPSTKAINSKDYGTKELQAKRRLGITSELLDRLLESRTITEQQHAAGLKFRWLYNVNFGLATLKAYDPSEPKGRYIGKTHNEKYLGQMKRLYNEIIQILKDIELEKVVMGICIYNIALKCHHFYESRVQKGMEILEKTLSTKGKKLYNVSNRTNKKIT